MEEIILNFLMVGFSSENLTNYCAEMILDFLSLQQTDKKDVSKAKHLDILKMTIRKYHLRRLHCTCVNYESILHIRS